MNRPFQPPDAPSRPQAQAGAAPGPDQAGPHPDGRDGARLAFLSILAFWSIYFILATINAAVADLPAQGEMLVRRTLVTLVAIGFTAILYAVLRRHAAARTSRLVAIAFAASVPLALAYATVNWVAFYYVPIEAHLSMPGGESYATKPAHVAILSTAIEWYFFICCWAVMWVALFYAERVKHAERQAAAFQRAAQEAELRALRYQVNPHFLFNTLNSLSSLVMHGRTADAEAMILNLSTFFRASLARDATENIPLADEIRLQRLYLDIEAVRFPERLRVRILVPDHLSDALVPALILQPIVENAIKYGVSRTNRPVTVTIAADASLDRLDLWVRDDGDSKPAPERPPGDCSQGCGVGLANVAARLKAAWGDAADCIAGSPSAGGWIVRLSMPLVRG